MTHPWALGWEALVAFGTLALATVTYLLARETRNLARSTAAEVAAQARPQMVPGGAGVPVPGTYDGVGVPNLHQMNERWLRICLRNAGSGTALNLRGHVEPNGDLPQRVMAIPAGEEIIVEFHELSLAPQRLTLEYSDISNRAFRSVINLRERKNQDQAQALRTYDFDGVWLSDGGS